MQTKELNIYLHHCPTIQDVDLIWFKDPMKFFHDSESAIANYDVYFQGKAFFLAKYCHQVEANNNLLATSPLFIR